MRENPLEQKVDLVLRTGLSAAIFNKRNPKINKKKMKKEKTTLNLKPSC